MKLTGEATTENRLALIATVSKDGTVVEPESLSCAVDVTPGELGGGPLASTVLIEQIKRAGALTQVMLFIVLNPLSALQPCTSIFVDVQAWRHLVLRKEMGRKTLVFALEPAFMVVCFAPITELCREVLRARHLLSPRSWVAGVCRHLCDRSRPRHHCTYSNLAV